jgi:hypothetical protein
MIDKAQKLSNQEACYWKQGRNIVGLYLAKTVADMKGHEMRHFCPTALKAMDCYITIQLLYQHSVSISKHVYNKWFRFHETGLYNTWVEYLVLTESK